MSRDDNFVAHKNKYIQHYTVTREARGLGEFEFLDVESGDVSTNCISEIQGSKNCIMILHTAGSFRFARFGENHEPALYPSSPRHTIPFPSLCFFRLCKMHSTTRRTTLLFCSPVCHRTLYSVLEQSWCSAEAAFWSNPCSCTFTPTTPTRFFLTTISKAFTG